MLCNQGDPSLRAKYLSSYVTILEGQRVCLMTVLRTHSKVILTNLQALVKMTGNYSRQNPTYNLWDGILGS